MAILLEDLYESTKQQYQLTLLAGENGVRKIVNWIYVAEDQENARFLKEGQLIISTGFIASQDINWMKSFIRTLIEKGTCGLLLNTGKYVTEKDITPDIIAMCNESGFPLIIMPWDYSICELSQDYCNRIFEEVQRTYELSNALHTILLDERISSHVLDTLANRSYQPGDTYCLGLLDFDIEEEPGELPQPGELLSAPTIPLPSAPSIPLPDARQHCLQLLRQSAAFCPSARQTDHVCLDYRKHLVIVWHNTSDAAIEAHSRELLSCCASISSIKNETMGISLQTAGIDHLPKLYAQAAAALTMAESVKQNWYHFHDLGCYQILFSSGDREVLYQYYRKYIGVLEDYDQNHASSYLETLENYLRFDQHLSKIAEAMICHRNTVNYRINKIRELLEMDLNDGESKFHLQLSIHIRNFLRIFDN